MADNPLKLEIEAAITDNQMDDSIRKIQNKLKSLEDIHKTSPQSQMSNHAEAAKNNQSKVLQDMQKRYLDDVNKRQDQVKQTMESIDKLYQNQMMSEKARVDMQEKMLKLKQEELKLEETKQKYGTPTDDKTPKPETPEPKQTKKPTLFDQLKDKIGTPTMAAAGGMFALQSAMKAMEVNARAPMVTAQAQAQAIQGAARPLSEVYEGDALKGSVFKEERAKAMKIATDKADTTRLLDTMKLAMPILGAAAGAALGGLVGGVPGAVVGGKAGFGMGVGFTAANAAFSDKGMARAKSAFGDSQQYEAMMAAETMADWEKTEASVIAQDFKKSKAFNTFNQYKSPLLQRERSLGFQTSEEGIQNLQDKMAMGNFSMQDITSEEQTMRKAGASSEGLRGTGAVTAARLKTYGVESAGNIMGRLESIDKDAGKSDENMRKILTEAVKSGVNLSTMPVELNRFSEKAVELATSSGGFNEEAVKMLSQSISDITSKPQAEAGASFVQQMMQQSRTFEGLGGRVGYEVMQGGRGRAALGENMFGALQEDAKMQAYLQSKGVDILGDPKELESIVKQLDKTGEFKDNKEEGVNRLKDLLTTMVESKTTLNSPEILKQQEEVAKAREESNKNKKDTDKPFEETEEYQDYLTSTKKTLSTHATSYGMSYREQEGQATYLLRDKNKQISGTGMESVDTLMQTNKGTVFQAEKEKQAQGEAAKLLNMQDYFKDFADAARKPFDVQLQMATSMMTEFKEVLKTGGSEAMQAFKNQILEAGGIKVPKYEDYQQEQQLVNATEQKMQNLKPSGATKGSY